VASLERARSMRRLFQLHRHGPGLLVGLVIVSSWRRDSSRASNIQYSAIFSYALFMDGSLACAARCLASSALRRQVSLSDDIRGGSLNAPEPSGKCGLHGRSESPNPTNNRHAFYANNAAATSTIAKTNATTPENRAESLTIFVMLARRFPRRVGALMRSAPCLTGIYFPLFPPYGARVDR
jgi:hypothetical protein